MARDTRNLTVPRYDAAEASTYGDLPRVRGPRRHVGR
jgi:hypothetical protein